MSFAEAHDRLEITQFKTREESGRFLVTGQIMSTDLLPREILKRDIFKILGKEARLEHSIPELEPYTIVGEVVKVWWVDEADAPFATVEVYGDTDVDLQLREDLLNDQKLPLAERKYRGFSIGILKYSNAENGEIVKILPREISFTKDPACDLCMISEAYLKNLIEVGQFSMSNKETLDVLREAFSQQLKSKDKVIELQEKEISDLKEKLKKKVDEFSASDDVSVAKIAEKVSIIDEKQKRIIEVEAELNTQKEENKVLAEEKRVAIITPLVEAILVAASYSNGSERYKVERELLMKKSAADLVDIAKFQKRDIKIFGQPLVEQGSGLVSGLPIEAKPFIPGQENKIEIPADKVRDVI